MDVRSTRIWAAISAAALLLAGALLIWATPADAADLGAATGAAASEH